MATIESMFSLVRMHVRNCPEPAMQDALLRIAREFCVKTTFLRETVVIDVIAGQDIYAIEPTGADAEVIGIVTAKMCETSIDPTQVEDIDGCSDDVFWVFEPPSQIYLTSTPDYSQEGGLLVRAVLQPTDSATTLPDSLLRKYSTCISDGAIAWLCSMSDAAWYWPDGIARFNDSYTRWLARAQADANRGNRSRGFRVKAWA